MPSSGCLHHAPASDRGGSQNTLHDYSVGRRQPAEIRSEGQALAACWLWREVGNLMLHGTRAQLFAEPARYQNVHD